MSFDLRHLRRTSGECEDSSMKGNVSLGMESELSQWSDEDLIELVLRNCGKRSDDALEVLFGRYRSQVHALLRSLISRNNIGPVDADDLASETFVAAWKGLETLRNGRLFKWWLLSIAQHKFYDQARRVRRDKSRNDVSFDAVLNGAGGSQRRSERPEARVEAGERGRFVQTIYEELGLKDRIVLDHVVEERPDQELADELGIGLRGANARKLRLLTRICERFGPRFEQLFQ